MQILDPLVEQVHKRMGESSKLNTEAREQRWEEPLRYGSCLGRGYIPGVKKGGMLYISGVGGSIPGLERVISTTWVCVLS